jgi:hypothetical protein
MLVPSLRGRASRVARETLVATREVASQVATVSTAVTCTQPPSMEEKKRPDREGLSEAIGSPTAEVFEMKRPAIAAKAGAGQFFVWWRVDVLRAQ